MSMYAKTGCFGKSNEVLRRDVEVVEYSLSRCTVLQVVTAIPLQQLPMSYYAETSCYALSSLFFPNYHIDHISCRISQNSLVSREGEFEVVADSSTRRAAQCHWEWGCYLLCN